MICHVHTGRIAGLSQSLTLPLHRNGRACLCWWCEQPGARQLYRRAGQGYPGELTSSFSPPLPDRSVVPVLAQKIPNPGRNPRGFSAVSFSCGAFFFHELDSKNGWRMPARYSDRGPCIKRDNAVDMRWFGIPPGEWGKTESSRSPHASWI